MHPQFSPRNELGILLISVARQWQRSIADSLARKGFSDTNWMVLVRLDEEGEDLTQIELARRLGIDRSNLVRILDQLTKDGLIERRPDPQDRRAHRLFLTRHGKEHTQAIRAHIYTAEAALLGDIQGGETDATIRTLRVLAARLMSGA